MSRKNEASRKDELWRRLDERGLHLTRQRAAVYDYLCQAKHHPTAEEVYRGVKSRLPRISLATVYKNLEALADCGAISKLTYGDAAARYEVRTDFHYHTRCIACGRVWDLDAEKGPGLLKQIKAQAGFDVTDYRLELLGHCRDCRRESPRPKAALHDD